MRHAILFSLLLSACVASTSSTYQAIDDDGYPADVPASLAPAADQRLAFGVSAIGTQNYACTNGAWVFTGPDAQLYRDNVRHPIGHHYAGPAGPTAPIWEYQDGSTVVGKKAAAATVDPASIPWLLLLGVGHNDVVGRMTDITSIQRLETSGGLAPAGACTNGATVEVPYTATYWFYRTQLADE